jgi:hypothetical protein
MKKVFSHWKTTSLGILSIIGGITRVAFAIKSGDFTEEAIMTSATTVLTGVGLLFAADNTAPIDTPKIVKDDK